MLWVSPRDNQIKDVVYKLDDLIETMVSSQPKTRSSNVDSSYIVHELIKLKQEICSTTERLKNKEQHDIDDGGIFNNYSGVLPRLL